MGDIEKILLAFAAALGILAVVTFPLAHPWAHGVAAMLLVFGLVFTAAAMSAEEWVRV